MIPRYSLPEMAAIWTEGAKLARWTEVEALALDAWATIGKAPATAGAAVRATAPVDTRVWKMREEETGHDLAAFVDVLAESMDRDAEWLHYGLTSSDVLDTAQGATLKAAGGLLLQRVDGLLSAVVEKAFEHRDTVMVGRTHGVWAEPTTFGLKLATWAFELDRDRERLSRAVDGVSVGKISGAVGGYAHVPPSVEAHVCEALGLSVEPASSQITHRDRHAEFVSTLALVGASLERFAVEIRHLQRSEVAEVREAFDKGQKGSSAMPHKRNPIAAENVTGLARLLRGYAVAALEDVALWHERDISHSSVERIVLPDACLVLDFALDRMTRLLARLEVDGTRMAANLEATRGLVYSQAVLLALVEEQVLDRDAAYRIVQRNAAGAWESGGTLRTHLEADPEVTLSPERLDHCFDPAVHLANAHVVFERLEKLRR
jgi:adenylosuccinate lyase